MNERASANKWIAPARRLSSIAEPQCFCLRSKGKRSQGEANAKKDVVVFLLLITAGTLAAQSKKFRPGFNLFSKEQDIQLGQESAADVEKKMKVLDSPVVQAYIRECRFA